jgi:hypothetical protein
MTELERLKAYRKQAASTLQDCLKYMQLAAQHGKFHRDGIGELEGMRGRIEVKVERLNEIDNPNLYD